MSAAYHDDRVPGAEDAIIEDRKLLEYVLNPEHPIGRQKALFFEAIGYERGDYEDLRSGILDALPLVPGSFVRTNPDDADNWEAIITIRRLDKDDVANIVTVWEVRDGHTTRMITVYPE